MDEAKLIALLQEDAPPARDFAFELAVMARIERRQFVRSLAGTVALAVVGALLLALLAPTLEHLWHNNFAPLASNLVIAVVLLTATIMAPQLYPAQD